MERMSAATSHNMLLLRLLLLEDDELDVLDDWTL
jgi:hypothetical protein